MIFLVGMTLGHGQQIAAQTVADRPLHTQATLQSIKENIALLGHTDPKVRRNARTELEQLGTAAINELEKAAKFESTSDYETQITAADILRTLQNSLAIKAADKFVHGEGTLNGWPTFKKFVGDTLESRSIFRNVYLRNRVELENAIRSTAPSENTAGYFQLKALFESPEQPKVHFGMFLLAKQLTELKSAQSNDESASLNAILTKQQLEYLFSLLTKNISLQTKTPSSIVLLVRSIIENAPEEYPLLNKQVLLLQKFDSPELHPLLVELAAKEKPTVVRAMAIAHAIKTSDDNTFNQFNTYLSDTTVIGRYLAIQPKFDSAKNDKPDIIEVQIRDLILLGNLRHAGENHTEFGFDSQAFNIVNNEVDIKLAGFINNEAREKAFERYRQINQ